MSFNSDTKESTMQRWIATFLAMAACACGNQSPDIEGVTPYIHVNEGRIYILGSEASAKKFIKSPHLPYAKTRIAEGPGGATLIFEIDKKNPDLAPSLEKAWDSSQGADAPFWVHHRHGRYYIIGNAKTNLTFLSQGHMPYAKTLIGEGPGGATLVFEIDKKDPELASRLVESFKQAY